MPVGELSLPFHVLGELGPIVHLAKFDRCATALYRVLHEMPVIRIVISGENDEFVFHVKGARVRRPEPSGPLSPIIHLWWGKARWEITHLRRPGSAGISAGVLR